MLHSFDRITMTIIFWYITPNLYPMERCRVIESPNGALQKYHFKTHGSYCLGPLIFIYCFQRLKWNGCSWSFLICLLMHILLLVCNNLPSTQTILDILIKLMEEVHLYNKNFNLTDIRSYILFYQSGGLLNKLTSSTR